MLPNQRSKLYMLRILSSLHNKLIQIRRASDMLARTAL
jgi:hypothetical protein